MAQLLDSSGTPSDYSKCHYIIWKWPHTDFHSYFSMIVCHFKNSKRERERERYWYHGVRDRHSSTTDKLLVDHKRSLIINFSTYSVLSYLSGSHHSFVIPPASLKSPDTHKLQSIAPPSHNYCLVTMVKHELMRPKQVCVTTFFSLFLNSRFQGILHEQKLIWM